MPEPLVWTLALCKTYSGRGAAVSALRDVSLEIGRGEFVAIIGRSGSGKSTLMNLLGLLDRPSSGRYLFNGREVDALREDDRAELRSREIGFVFQSSVLLPRSVAVANVELPLAYAGVGRTERRRRAEAALDRVGMTSRCGHWPHQLSGGEQQRVAIARALVNDPALILADEPTGSLDSRTGEDILSLFAELNRQGRTFVVVTHAPDVARHARRMITIADGAVVHDQMTVRTTVVAQTQHRRAEM
jgi:putative ABC transport system ATP-binding protein